MRPNQRTSTAVFHRKTFGCGKEDRYQFFLHFVQNKSPKGKNRWDKMVISEYFTLLPSKHKVFKHYTTLPFGRLEILGFQTAELS